MIVKSVTIYYSCLLQK